jgi:hypothetical protein
MFPTTYNTETELSAVNTILGTIGQSPVTELDYNNPEIFYAYSLLQDTTIDVQSEGWVFNTEKYYPLVPNSNEEIEIPANVIQMDFTGDPIYRDKDVIRREGKLYDKLSHSYKFDRTVYADITWKFEYEDLPPCFRRYIAYRAARRAAANLIGNPDAYKMVTETEGMARAACVEYECNQGDYSFFGFENGYHSYQPYNALAR